MSVDRIILNQLAFTGPQDTRSVEFVSGLNVIWGASNAGKSFMVKSLDFMFGGSKLVPVSELQRFDRCWLEMDLPRSGTTTFGRATKGGGFAVFHTSFEAAVGQETDTVLSSQHSTKTESLSGFLLAELGIEDKRIASTQTADKVAFTFRHFAHYLLTEETPMMAEWSPIQISPKTSDTFHKNVLKFILTGQDDASLVVFRSVKEQRNANLGKIEIVDEMIVAVQAELAAMYPDEEDVDALDLASQDERLTNSLQANQTTLSSSQAYLDGLVQRRRVLNHEVEELSGRVAAIGQTLERFDLLQSVYNSDVERLEALDEGAAALLAGALRPCPLCGADPEHQHALHGFSAVETSKQAVVAEIKKINAEKSDLVRTVRSLAAERDGLLQRQNETMENLRATDIRITTARQNEAEARRGYEKILAARQRVREGIAVKRRLDSLRIRRSELDGFKAVRAGDPAVPGIDGPMGHDFAMIVQSILREWKFPGEPVISFSEKTHDILLNGSERASNGKGVRALMNAAYKLGVLMFCRERSLPHPGIVVLDSPLLSYRDPHTSRHGDLSVDEIEVRNAGLNTYFYEFLERRALDTQIIVIENDPPPFSLSANSKTTTFAGPNSSAGRIGLL